MNPELPAKAGAREWIGLAVIALPCILYAMDLTVLNLALPRISAELKPGSSELLWIVDIYGFMVSGFLITMGTLGDRIGRRKLLLTGACAFGVASVLAAYSSSARMLIGARALLGIAGATLAPSTLSLIRNMFHDQKQRTFAIGVWITSYSVGGLIGPLIGGVLLEHYGWGSVFLIAIPVMILLLVLAPFLLPEYKDPAPGRLDLVSTVLSLLAVLLVIFGLKRFAENGIGWLSFCCILSGCIIGVLFFRRQKTLSDPVIDTRLFHLPLFSTSLLIYTLSTFVVFGISLFSFQYLQLITGFTPVKAGLWSLPSFFAFILGSLVTPRIVRRIDPATVMSAGLCIAAIGFGLLTQVGVDNSPALLVTGIFICCLGTAPVFTLATDIIISASPPEKAGVASALSETGSEFGGALGIAILGSIGGAIYRARLDAITISGLPPDVLKAAKATLSGAITASGRLPKLPAESLLRAANTAFVAGMKVAALICCVIAIALSVICMYRIRRRQAAVM